MAFRYVTPAEPNHDPRRDIVFPFAASLASLASTHNLLVACIITLPAPEVIAAEIADDLEAALEQFSKIAARLTKEEASP